MSFTKPLCQMDIVRIEQSKALKKLLRAVQNNSCGTDCRNFAVDFLLVPFAMEYNYNVTRSSVILRSRENCSILEI